MRYITAHNNKYKVVLDNNGEGTFYLDLYKKDEDDKRRWLDEAVDSTWTDLSTEASREDAQKVADNLLEGVIAAYKKGFEDRQVLLQAKCYAGI